MRFSHSENGSDGGETPLVASLLRLNYFPVPSEKLPCSAKNRESAPNSLESLVFSERFPRFGAGKREIRCVIALTGKNHPRSSPDAFGEPCAKDEASQLGYGSGRPGGKEMNGVSRLRDHSNQDRARSKAALKITDVGSRFRSGCRGASVGRMSGDEPSRRRSSPAGRACPCRRGSRLRPRAGGRSEGLRPLADLLRRRAQSDRFR